MKIHLVALSLCAAALLPVSSFAAAAPPAGKKLYDSKCAACHGTDGKGKPAMAKVFKVDPSLLDMTLPVTLQKKDEDLLKIIADGKNKMPAYAKQLKPADQAAVLQYLRSLAPKPDEKSKEGKP